MANGQPRPAFYVAVFVVVARPRRPRALALRRDRPAARRPVRFSGDELKQMQKGAEAPDSSGITTVKEYNYVAGRRSCPRSRASPATQPMADRTVRFAINVWAGWGPIIYANNGFKPGKVWKTPGGKDFKVELVLIDDPVAMRDAYAAGNLHVGWATLDMVPLFLEGLRKDSRVMPRIYQQVDWSNGGDGIVVRDSDQDDGRPARQDGRARAELAVALLRAERADQRRRAAGGSGVQVHPGRVPGRRRVQRRQEPGRRRQLGARHLQPREGQGQPDARHDRDGQQADRRRLVRARRLRQGQPRHHGRASSAASSTRCRT